MDNKEKPTRLKDIADVAGVSVDTVSRVLLGKTKGLRASSADKIKRIKQLADEMNYRPNRAAQVMRTNRTHQVGVVLAGIYNPHTARTLEQMAEVLETYGYGLLLGILKISPNTNTEKRLKEFSMNLMDAVLNLHPLVSDAFLHSVFTQIPALTWDRSAESSPSIMDRPKGVSVALEYLWEQGHRKIAMIIGEELNPNERAERSGTLESFYHKHGLPFHPGDIIYTGRRFNDGEDAVEPFLATGATACISGNDLLAGGICSGLRNQGFEIPRDYSLISMDDTILARVSSPPLTAIHPPIEDMVTITVHALMEMIEGRKMPPCQTLTPGLTIRGSVRALQQ